MIVSVTTSEVNTGVGTIQYSGRTELLLMMLDSSAFQSNAASLVSRSVILMRMPPVSPTVKIHETTSNSLLSQPYSLTVRSMMSPTSRLIARVPNSAEIVICSLDLNSVCLAMRCACALPVTIPKGRSTMFSMLLSSAKNAALVIAG